MLVTAVTGCQKVLDIKPESDLDGADRFKTIEDHQYALLGAYGRFQSTNYYGSFDGSSNAFVTLPDMMAEDLVETGESLGNAYVFSSWTYESDEVQVENTWLAAYRIINQINLTLRGIDTFASADPDQVAAIKGQALAIRAMVHFDVLRYWANDYDRNSLEPGVPYMTVYNYEQKPARGTVKQTYDGIEKDLLDAKDLLAGLAINDDGDRAYMDEFAVDAILARVYLYSGQMDKAIDAATAVIDEFPLATRASFPGIWTDANVDEVVWSMAFDAGQGTPATNTYAPDVNRSQFRPSNAFMSLFDRDNDIRGQVYFDLRANRNGTNRWVQTKYLAKSSRLKKPDGVVNFKALRVGEMYLIRAEANVKSGTPDQAAAMDDLNTLRHARINGYTDENLTGVALTNAIEVERRKELFLEGHRFFDVKRKGQNNRRIDRGCTDSDCVLEPTAREWAWPIPQPEIDANPNILPQNDGY